MPLNLSPQRCDSCNAAELVMRYSPDHGATFCIPCHERENPTPVADPDDTKDGQR